MKYPNFNEEKKLWKRGYKFVAGLDEAGRGPLAGPVVAAAVVISNFEIRNSNSGIRDSKLMSAKQREEVYEKLIGCKNILWGVGVVSEKVIDKINILQATKLAMKKALFDLSFPRKRESRVLCTCPWIPNQVGNDTGKIDFLLIDGNFTLRHPSTRLRAGARGEKYILQKSIVKGDQRVFSVAAASIIAKVTRDRIMKKYHKKYPQYGFAKHKGYGTKAHFASLEKFGPCKIHRKSFYPVNTYPQTAVCLQISKEVK